VFPIVVQGQRFDVGVSTNSSEYGIRLKIIDRQLQFFAAGEAGTSGHAEITVPKNLTDGLAFQEGAYESVSVSLEGNSTHNKIIMNYPHRELLGLIPLLRPR
jgi:hypothetical protein